MDLYDHENVNIDLNKKKNFIIMIFLLHIMVLIKILHFKYLDLIFLTINNTISIIELNLYINFLKLFLFISR